jgi:hypothetical protein
MVGSLLIDWRRVESRPSIHFLQVTQLLDVHGLLLLTRSNTSSDQAHSSFATLAKTSCAQVHAVSAS